MSGNQVGLVLSGGGAKGAYQAGVVRGMAESGTRVDALSGASIGALNAAILACAPNLQEGAARLQDLWATLAAEQPLQHRLPAYAKFALMFGACYGGGAFVSVLERFGGSALLGNYVGGGLLSTSPLHRIMDKYIDPDALARGIPLYISVYRSDGAWADLSKTILAELGVRDTKHSEFFHLQSLPREERRALLLASAALPVLYSNRNVGGVRYADGGMGGWRTLQGNTPITPLLQAGIKHVIVSHLTDGSHWNRQDFPEATVLEIRPQSPLERNGLLDMLAFEDDRIQEWMRQGYDDTRACLGRVVKAQQARAELAVSESQLSANQRDLEQSGTVLADALARLRRS